MCHLCLEVFHGAEGLYTSSYRTSEDRQDDGIRLYHEIKSHMQLHLSVGTKYACDKCTLTFTSSFDFIIHQKSSHSNVKVNRVKLPVKASGFKREDFVVPVDALERIVFYKDEPTMKQTIAVDQLAPVVSVNAEYRQAAKFSSDYVYKPGLRASD